MTEILHPYLREASRRAALIGANADVRPEHYTFARQQKLYTPPLQRSAPVTGIWNDWAAAILIALAIACLLVWTV